MSFFGPISSPTLDESSAPIIRRALHRARVVGNFAAVQAIVQVIGFLSGILLVRSLSQREYAYFTIANTMQGTINLLADIGISVGLISIGGRVWHDRHRFGELINTALSVRRKLGAIAIVIVTPIMYFMLVKNGMSIPYALILILVVLGGLGPTVRWFERCPPAADVGHPNHRSYRSAYPPPLLGADLLIYECGRGRSVATAVLLLQYAMLHSYVAGVVDLKAEENAEDRRETSLDQHLALRRFLAFVGDNNFFH
jgi:hypothetical protein